MAYRDQCCQQLSHLGKLLCRALQCCQQLSLLANYYAALSSVANSCHCWANYYAELSNVANSCDCWANYRAALSSVANSCHCWANYYAALSSVVNRCHCLNLICNFSKIKGCENFSRSAPKTRFIFYISFSLEVTENLHEQKYFLKRCSSCFV